MFKVKHCDKVQKKKIDVTFTFDIECPNTMHVRYKNINKVIYNLRIMQKKK